MATLLLWPSDTDTPLKLGPSKWKTRGGGNGAEFNIGLSPPIDVAELKKAAKQQGATVNDLLLLATGQGIRNYLKSTSGEQNIKMKAVMVINARPDMPQVGTGRGRVRATARVWVRLRSG